LSHADEFVSVLGPIVKSLGVEVRTIWPGQRPKRCIEFDGVEQVQVPERGKHFPFQDRTKVDSLPAAVLKANCQVGCLVVTSFSLVAYGQTAGPPQQSSASTSSAPAVSPRFITMTSSSWPETSETTKRP
jgi:hypothetical protein